MSEGFDPTIVIFAALAIFVVWKLRSVLGSRTGEEKPPANPFERFRSPSDPSLPKADVLLFPKDGPSTKAKDTEERWKGYADKGSPLSGALDAVHAADPNFTPASFLDGAKSAYEMIVSSFAKGDRASLRMLLSADVLESFDSAITTREQRGEVAESTFVAMHSATIVDAQLRQGAAQVTVRFSSSLINATRDRAGEVVDGDPEKVVEHEDVWTFARDVRSTDPNWKLIATDSPV